MNKILPALLLICSAVRGYSQKNTLLKATDTLYIHLKKEDLPAYLKRHPVQIDSSTLKPATVTVTPPTIPAPPPAPKVVPPPAPLSGNVYAPSFANQSANLSVKISLPQSSFNNIDDIKLNIVVTNTSYRAQSFLFDRPAKASNGIWACRCILSHERAAVIRYPYNSTPEAKAYSEKDLEKFYYTLKPGEWIMKIYSLRSLVTFDDSLLVNGKLPKGRYTLQLNIQNNPSNTVSFVFR